MIIAIDGPSGAGKSSTSKGLAIRGNWEYLDTGALYRAVTLIALKENISTEDELLNILEKYQIEFHSDPTKPMVLINGIDVNNDIRSEAVTSEVSRISSWPPVRKY